ncbi:MAG TPA: TonB family protein [Woeseiaceae bacterium]|nr:TonB family protein [Woeseiaceae bacterium]
MARDQVRTQVLLLHSEQSTLDSLSAGFDDRYTVHCATSGTEALHTLGDTPIHVIVSARDLPGMSGVEALREAKKRSPETIGILLAGDNDQGLEALVGDKEVFQVVRGGVKPADLTKLVDNATRQMRLLALAESANDMAANPDEPAEHIVMETSEHGSAIISGGTGTLPVLDPAKIASAVAAGSNKVEVLVVTKDDDFLTTIRESTRGMHKVHYASTLAQAEEALAAGKVGVAVVDAAMVGENVEKLTQHLRRKTKRLVNIVAGRRDDGEMLMDLINRGKVYRFLLKPVSPGRARLAIEASVKHHLEAPESAFRVSGAPGADPSRTAAKSAPRPAGKPAVKPAANPTGKLAAKLAAKPGRKSPATAPSNPQPGAPPPGAAPTGAAPSDGPTTPAGSAAPADAGQMGAFGTEDQSFTETMTGIVTNLGKALTRKKDKPAAPEKAEPGPRIEPVLNPVRPVPMRHAGAPAAPATTALKATGAGTPFANPKVLGGIAAAVVALGVLGYFVLGGGESSRPEGTDAPVADRAGNPGGQALPVGDTEAGALLDEARLARQAGNIYNPPGSNAIELYEEALAAAPGDPLIAAELNAVVDEALRMAETAMLERRAGEAAMSLDRVAFVDPGNGRLPFLFAQLAQMQLRDYLDAGRAALRELRFEDVASAIAAARELDVTDTGEIDALAQELTAARSEQRVDETLALAAASLEAGNLVAPANDNARFYYELVLSNDPENLLAQQGLSAVASKLVLQARGEIDAGRFETAGALLDDARRLDPSSDELANAAQALDDAEERVLAEQRQRESDELAAEQQRVANERAAAERRAEATGDGAGVAQAAAPTTAAVAADGNTADSADDTTAEAAEVAAGDSADAAGDAEAEQDSDGSLLGMSDLTRVKYVAPKYPRAAERRNLSGWVDVVFTVQADGTTGDIEVRNSDPGDMFVSAAVRAVEKWEFEPVVENGEVVERQAGVRMMFALE